MKDHENYPRPLADHEIKRRSPLTAALVILLALTLPALLIPDEDEQPVEVVETANVPQLEQPEQTTSLETPPPDSLDPFGDYATQESPWSLQGILESIKHFILSYTVFGFIYQNVDQKKVNGSFQDLHEKSRPIRERQESKK